MSEENKEQAVIDEADDQTANKSGAEDADARDEGDDLEALLSEYDAENGDDEVRSPTGKEDGKSAKPAPESEQDKDKSQDFEAIDRRLREFEKREAERLYRQDMDKAIKAVRGDMDGDLFDDRFMEAWIDSQARDDPRLTKAWQERHDNPKRFKSILDGLGKKFAKKYSKLPDKEATEDREAVSAAVRGASGKAPEPKAPDYSKMTDAEFRDAMEKDHGFSPLI